MAKGEDITTRYKLDISDLKKNISEANNYIKLANSEFKKASSGMDDWTKSTDGLSAKLKQLKSTMEAQVSKLQDRLVIAGFSLLDERRKVSGKRRRYYNSI